MELILRIGGLSYLMQGKFMSGTVLSVLAGVGAQLHMAGAARIDSAPDELGHAESSIGESSWCGNSDHVEL
ncbi:hypothetical protein OG906_34125 [Streptomyces sp. NBC_01426]|uniref:hypothetical protein n=1 Tax=Streptomyces sp. NBC_01426 TaxID=2975866 RepID=UPI002E2F6045|nr:hypothetical protein [Streptomyces sp. NBC_01426]